MLPFFVSIETKIDPENFCSKSSEIFKRPKNREDSSDLDDFLTKLIATSQTFFSKIFASLKKNRVDEKSSLRPNKPAPPNGRWTNEN